MTDEAPPDPSASPAPGAVPLARRPRKIFLVVGLVAAVALGIGLFTSVGTSQNDTSAPRVGGLVPAFTASNEGPVGPSEVSVPADGGGNGTPAVLLFFGAWCSSCRQELPPLASTVRAQDETRGELSKIHVIGIDSFDSRSTAESFIHSEGLAIPVASDPSVAITSGLFYFKGDPYAVFVKGNGTISKIVIGAVLTPSSFTADERALIPSGR